MTFFRHPKLSQARQQNALRVVLYALKVDSMHTHTHVGIRIDGLFIDFGLS